MSEEAGKEMDTRQLIVDTATKMFADHVDKKMLDAAELGEFPDELWQLVVANGFHQLGSEGSGTDEADLFAFLMVCGQFAVPLPLAETLLANIWLAPDDTLASIGLVNGNSVRESHWGRAASRVIGIRPGASDVLVSLVPEVTNKHSNMGGEPADEVVLGDSTVVSVGPDPYAQLALTRVNLIAGCLQAQLDLGIQFATERSQFGRMISKFQAIQHSLAVVAAEVAAAKRAADAAVDAFHDDRFIPEVAAAKSRVGEAVGTVAEQVHQIHGAMGFTHEHRLHHFSRRTWAWRDAWGNEFEWQEKLGHHIANLGADNVWDFIATRS
ncbi:MAG: hypothetical protein GKR90_24290 [Pseudomonadales bacterium]|nr:hypothetical protein [Pseudomonadales bacterium]